MIATNKKVQQVYKVKESPAGFSRLLEHNSKIRIMKKLLLC